MKSLLLNMFKKINYIAAVLVLLGGNAALAQVTTQSPYSRYGVGNLKSLNLPQFKAMGGISSGVWKPDGYSYINMQNPASYAGIQYTSIDIGASGSISNLRRNGASESSFNATLSHVALAFPVTPRSALSFGVLPYSELGYQFSNSATLSSPGNSASQAVNYIYGGEGGLTKAYFGYGRQFGDHFRLGANVDYIFGNMLQTRSTEFVDQTNVLNSRFQTKNSVGGIGFSYGAQYHIDLDAKTSLNFGYSGSSSSNINSRRTFVVTQYLKDATTGNENGALDTLQITQDAKSSLKLPLVHNFGFTVEKFGRWMIGADYRMGKWANFMIDGQNQGLQNTYGMSVGGQITPDAGSISSYFNRVDYRLGFTYDKTYVRINDQDIKQMAVTFGFGFPLASTPSRLAFYKINFTTELGKRGTMTNNLLQENYINLHLGFTMNDKWFRRFRFD
ncbi:porin family protein [Pedobacter duraquae]|uniref:Long-subunit fatty acid transport protein n=1 Tax=Pedobacter duraquae TaxID=425511 RepID=A0A4R6IER5_9SPHI|nr:hypothetical protein [Pedobacter duraquae]TDO20138.1 long-subunit fatty acid transport protein [Pedobacter duraquae]